MTHHDSNVAFFVFIVICVAVAFALFDAAPAFVVGRYVLAAVGAFFQQLAAAPATWMPLASTAVFPPFVTA